MIQMHLSNTQILRMMFTIILMIITQKKKKSFDCGLVKKSQAIIKELFIRCRKLNI